MTGHPSEDIQAAFCAVLADEWARAGVTDAVVAPGSRSTPLVVALDREERIRVHVVLDERSAGFMALGLAFGSSGRPAVVVTTSGTASVELHPSVVEASQAGIPLIAITTDRPPELHHVGAAQTVEQHGLFAPAPVWEVDPGPADLAMRPAWRSLASRAVEEAVRGRGPVHVNLPFREPLIGNPGRVEVPPGRAGGRPWHEASVAIAPPPAELVGLLAKHAGGRGLIVAGEGAGPATLDLAARLGWPVLAEPRSGARAGSPYTVAAADALLRIEEVAGWVPDMVLRAGGPWASKVVAGWLAGLPPEVPQVLVDPRGRWADPGRQAARMAPTTPAALAEALGGPGQADEGWLARWRHAEDRAQRAIDGLLDKGAPLDASEPAVARAALAAVPDGGLLLASSSMPVRDVEWYGAPRTGATVRANRGANGIDGVLSTAIGASLVDHTSTIALVGDLAFLYDAGSLLWAPSRDVRLSVLVVDNDGGGIFSFLPQAEALTKEPFERFWGTPHRLDIAALARAYGVEAQQIASRPELDAFLARAGEPGCRVGVVSSDRAANVEAHDRINAAVAAAVLKA